MNLFGCAACTGGISLWLVGAASAVVMETVPVGNPGNVADGTGFGAVDYAYKIGKFEVTAGQYAEFLNAVGATDTYGLYATEMWSSGLGCKIQRSGSPGAYSYSVAAEWAQRPVNFVTWGDAARFANWLHNGRKTGAQDLTTTEDGSYFLNGATSDADLLAVTREPDATWVIPSEDEWYKAAYHKNDGPTGNYWDYPTASDGAPNNDLVDPDPGNNANFGFLIGDPYWRTEVGEFEKSASPYGTFDQAGNVWEWNEAILYTWYRGVRGGSFQDNDTGVMQAGHRSNGTATSGYSYVGFRLSRVPEPAAAALLAMGAVGLLGRRWRRARRCSLLWPL